MQQILDMQKSDANAQFFKFIKDNYKDWLYGDKDAPIMSHTLFREYVLPQMDRR